MYVSKRVRHLICASEDAMFVLLGELKDGET